MLRSKSKEDIGRHAEELLRKARNEYERKSRCFYIAQLFYEVKDFEQVISYVKEYLSVKSNSSSAYKLLGQAYEGLDQNDNALSAYENCLKYDENQHELLLKICELYLDSKINFDRVKAKHVLNLTQKYFPFHSIVENLRDRLMNDNNSVEDRDEHEKLLMVEIKNRPDDCKLRVSMIKLYLDTKRVELAYRTVKDIENMRLFPNKIEWFECCDLVYKAYRNCCETKCDTDFYLNWLQCLDNVCSLSYPVNNNSAPKNCTDSVLKLDKLLNVCWNKSNSDEYKLIIDHFSAQLSFHLAMLLILKTKERADFSSERQKIQIWFEDKTKIGALLLISVKDGINKPNPVYLSNESKAKSYQRRIDQSKARYVQVFYTLQSFAKNNNQGDKQLVECINYFISGNWKKEIYKVFDSTPNVDLTKSHFLNSSYFKDVPQKLPSENDIYLYYQSFERTYEGGLHHMIWLGLQTATCSDDPHSINVDSNLHMSVFKSLNLTTGSLDNKNIESLNQLDMDSFLYLIVLCKTLQLKKGRDQPVVLPSCVSTRLYSDKENRFWTNVLTLSQDLSREKEGKWSKHLKSSELSESDRFDMRVVLEQIRAHNLQLPLIVHLARTFSRRAEIEPPIVRDACEKRALHFWSTVLLNLKTADKKSILSNIKNPFFNYDFSHYSQTEIKNIGEEARMYIGTQHFKCGYYDKALENFKLIQTPDSLYKQAAVYEAMSLKESDDMAEDSRSKKTLNSDKARDCLTRAMDLINARGDKNHLLTQQISEKLRAWTSDEQQDNNYTSEGSRNDSDMEETQLNHTPVLFNNGVRRDYGVLSSTPKRLVGGVNSTQQHDDTGTQSHQRAPTGSDLTDLLTPYRNQLKLQTLQESLKLLSERLENYQSTSTNRLDCLYERLDRRFDKLESNLKTYFADLKKEVKQKPDLYNMLEEDDYTPEADVLGYSANYFQRNSGMMQAPAPAPPIPPTAAAFINANQLYQGGVPFYGQTVPFAEPQMADYLRTLAANQRNNALAAILPPLHQPTLVPTPNLSHVQIPNTSSPALTNKQQIQPQAPNNVVITTSDSLPTTVPTTTPTLFVNIPPEHRLGSAPIMSASPSAPHKFQIPMPADYKSVDKAPVADPAEDPDIEATLDVTKEDGVTLLEHDPLPNFKPVVPLPDEVEVKTGEEDETVLFEHRAKLFRFVDKEWKERGLGQLKLLKSADDKPRYRILMRREQVHKICANHFVTSDMKMIKAPGNDKSYIWWAHDFADEKVQVEKFLVRFKTVEDGQLFKEKFEEAREAAQESGDVIKTNETPKSSVLSPNKLVVGSTTSSEDSGQDKVFSHGGFTFSFQPKISMASEEPVQNVKEEKKQPGPFASFNFVTPKPETKTDQFGFGVPQVKMVETTSQNVSSETNSKLLELLKPEAGSWECTACYTRNTSGSKMCVACQTPSPSTTNKPVEKPLSSSSTVKKDSSLPSLSSIFKPAQGSWSCDMCLVQNKADVIDCIACGTLKPGCTAEQKPVNDTTFSFGIPSAPPVSKPAPSFFGVNSVTDTTKTQSGFGLVPPNTGSIFTFGEPTEKSTPSFTFGSAKFNFTMATPTKADDAKSPQTTPRSAHKSDVEDTDNEHDEDHDHTEGIYFQPVVDLPDKIEVKTGEEDEAVLYSQRAKLFRFDTVSKEWKERGVGDVKILRHQTSGKMRLLMRREPVMKLCLNHYLSPNLNVKAKDPKSWIWCAPDFSEGEQILEKFCIRFKTPDIAQEFKRNLDSAMSGSSPDDDDDVIFVSEVPVVSDELKNKALALKLPANFYKYLNLPDCPGCRGCESDSDSHTIPQGLPVSKVGEAPQKTPLFGQKTDNTQPVFFGSKASFTGGTIPDTPVTNLSTGGGGILSGKSIFGGALKPPVLSTPAVSSDQATFPPSSEPTKSAISSFNFAISQGNGTSTTTPVFSFSPQNTIFGGTPVFGQSTDIFGGQTKATPMFGQNNSSESKENKTSVFDSGGGLQSSFFGGSPAVVSPFFGGATNQSQSTTSIFGGGDNNQSQSVPTIFGSKINQNDSATPIFGSSKNETQLVTPTKNEQPDPSSLIFGSAADKSATPNSVGSVTPVSSKQDSSQKTTSVLGWNPVTSTEPVKSEAKKELLPALLNKDDGISFQTIAAKAEATNAFAGDNSNFKWEGAGTKLFGAKTTPDVKPQQIKESEEDTDKNESQENDEHDPYFEPVVPLPDKIDLKTGEEDEDVVFSERAKLYRRDPNTKEWKERGIGNIKLLKHRDRSTYRLLMRREQIHKIVCNHLVTPDLIFSPLKSSETSYCWGAMNISQDETEPSMELLCAKFKHRETALQFKAALDAAQLALTQN